MFVSSTSEPSSAAAAPSSQGMHSSLLLRRLPPKAPLAAAGTLSVDATLLAAIGRRMGRTSEAR